MSRGDGGLPCSAEAGFVTGANFSAPDCDGAKRLTRTNPDEMEFHEGEWFVVREGTAYEMETRTGYTALAGYKMGCRTHH